MISSSKSFSDLINPEEIHHQQTPAQKDIANLEHLTRLHQEHRDLDVAIRALQRVFDYDPLQVQRLKKRKLQLRDRINWTQDQITPDLIA